MGAVAVTFESAGGLGRCSYGCAHGVFQMSSISTNAEKAENDDQNSAAGSTDARMGQGVAVDPNEFARGEGVGGDEWRRIRRASA
jgi:hypothetical protein